MIDALTKVNVLLPQSARLAQYRWTALYEFKKSMEFPIWNSNRKSRGNSVMRLSSNVASYSTVLSAVLIYGKQLRRSWKVILKYS